ncbi:ATP-binding cassette subfamily B protein [Arthrobacter stackebrandtii]|uniref:ATP-binding cassette subfamily B protein n=1 Tax=Arthrobacter stackebrandtii TaxID=272161 RepID=A0ABS4Z180_9MICC|nr:ABC transporter ATP-binding protein [Arthrobacter stackebrandtii]MBP2414798.1 ATP-binding cassette subfamily B protein [Arthrobacter stackebrandtii]PYG99457.1 ABC transporter [Arthrobacter stackebrandtii]
MANHDTTLFSSLARIGPQLRPIMWRLIFGLLSALAASVVALAIPQVYRVLVNNALQPGNGTGALWLGTAVVLVLGIMEAWLLVLRRQLVIVPATTVETRMRTSFYRHLQNLSVEFHDRWGSGQLLSRAMSDLNFMRRWMAFGAIMLVVTALTVAIGVALMFSMSWELGLIFLAAAVPIVIFGFTFRRSYGQASRRSQDQAGDLATVVEESVHGIRVLKAFGRGREALDSFAGQAQELQATEIHKAKSLATFSLVVTLLPELALAAGLVVGILLVHAGRLDVGTLVAFFATAAVVAGPVESMGPLLSMTLTAKTALDRHFEVMDAESTITDPEEPVHLGAVRGTLEFRDVHFRFPDTPEGTADLLNGIDLELRAGETMALVGVTGSGKSTLLNLVPRLFDPTGGALLLDGVDIRRIPLAELRTHVSVAFEDTTLFSNSVRENVLLGAADHPGLSADEVLEQALDVAQAGFAHTLPQGVDTLIGEEGLSLSGGQRQRIALARAIAAKPAVLVLDDPLSALDVNTEERVSRRLRQVLEGTTTLIVAHRPSTVAMADRVALLQDGRITAVGTHAVLLAGNDHYRYVLASLDTEPKDLDSGLDDELPDDLGTGPLPVAVRTGAPNPAATTSKGTKA